MTQAIADFNSPLALNELALHNRILQAINQGVDLWALLSDLAIQIEQQYIHLYCSILIVSEDNQRFLYGAAPSLPQLQKNIDDGLVISEINCCAIKGISDKAIIIENVDNYSRCELSSYFFFDVYEQSEIRACYAKPIKNNTGQILGTVALYSRYAKKPSEFELHLLKSCSYLSQIAIERYQADVVLKRYKLIINHANDGFWLISSQGFLQEVNLAYAQMIGFSVAELQGKHITQLDAKEKDITEVKAHIAKIIAQGSDYFETQHRHKLGHIIDVEISASYLAQAQQFFVFIRDITERKKAERALAESELMNRSNNERLILATKIASFGVWDWIVNDNNIVWNDTMFDIYGISKSAVVSYETWLNAIVPEDHVKLIQSMQKLLHEHCHEETEFRIMRPDGEIRYIFSAKGVVVDDDKQILRVVGVNVDVTERNNAQQTIRQLAFYDDVTGLANRRLLLERLGNSLASKQHNDSYAQLALLMLDLDHFKAVNDCFGHAAGDELLQQVAARLQTHACAGDTVARLGGDEFVLLLEQDNTDPQNQLALTALHIAQNIIADLSRPFYLSFSHDVRIGVSVGISIYPQHGTHSDTLLNNADVALYQAKRAGRGGFAYFSEQTHRLMRERSHLESRLHKAIEQNELRLFYQPQVDIISGKIIGAEALMRWQSNNELISPSRFIEIAEESHLIVHLGAWAVREICRQGKEWLMQGIAPLNLSINVSPFQFRRSNMYQTISAALSETQFPAHLLSIEITESGLMEHKDSILKSFHALRALGIRFAIDDFGTGYSSLAYLTKLPVDTLKIDKSFIDDIPQLADDMAITETIIAMGHTLGLKVLAEGVETPAQLKFLKEKGCDEYQGYLKSNPLPASEFALLLINN